MQQSLINHGRDLHLHHGPIDLIVSIRGSADKISKARVVACRRFETILHELVAELPELRQPVSSVCNVNGTIATRMHSAATKFIGTFATPMIAVAGAVADEVLNAILEHVDYLDSISVNNGGDIAVWHAPGHSSTMGVADPVDGRIIARARLAAGCGIGGVATSGRHGRSLSLGIADSVTVMAKDAATADAAATLISNAVDLPGNPSVRRVPASDINPDSDLGSLPATVHVGELRDEQTIQALQSGLEVARLFQRQGLVVAAYLLLQGRWVATGEDKASLYSLESDRNKIDQKIQSQAFKETTNA